jgi:prepilin-type processing-associated H-X9-DG protein
VPADGNACPALATFTLVIHVIMNVTWQPGTATNAGSGEVHLWNLSKLDANGTVLTGDTRPCGNVVPPIALNALGSLASGGNSVLIEVPTTVWDAPSIPRLRNTGSLAGWQVGDAISIDPGILLVGLTMPDPTAAWPAAIADITTVDADGDGSPGILAIPRSDGGYVRPPTAIGLGGSVPSADRLYLVTRSSIGMTGTTSSCESHSGTANIGFFDTHVVGCHVAGGQECTMDQASFIDQSRTIYQITSATFQTKRVADTATCAEVRAALPM